MKNLFIMILVFCFVGVGYSAEQDVGTDKQENTTVVSVDSVKTVSGLDAMEVVGVVALKNETGRYLAIKYSDGEREFVYCTNYIDQLTKQDSARINHLMNNSSGGIPFKQDVETQKAKSKILNHSSGGLPFLKRS